MANLNEQELNQANGGAATTKYYCKLCGGELKCSYVVRQAEVYERWQCSKCKDWATPENAIHAAEGEF